MSRTLEPGVSLLTAAEIRVVVVPIGPMPRDTFEAYLEALNAHRHVPLNATASFHQCGPKSPFPHLPYKTGAMHFRFMQAEDARRRSRVCDLHVQRNVVAVLGLLHCPLVEDLAAAHSEFLRTVRQWPEALVARCAAFEPSPAHLAAPTAKLQDLMIFPAGHLDQHLEVYMHEFAAAVLAAIEEHLLNATLASIKLNTYVDSGEFLGSLVQIEEGLRKLNSNEEEVERKRWGRLQKSKGDWSLLVGSPKDAFDHYKSAMSLSAGAGDAIWYGAAVEGLAHARVLEALLSARLAAAGGSSHHGRLTSAKPPPAAAVIPPEALDSPTRPVAEAAAGPGSVGDDAQQGSAASALPVVSTQASSSSSSTDMAAAGAEPGRPAGEDEAAAAAVTVSDSAVGVSAQAAGAPSASPFAASGAEGGAAAVSTQQASAADSAGAPSTPAVDLSNSSSSAAAGRASSLPAMPPPPSPTAAAATAAAAAQLARRRSVGSGAAALPPNYSLSGPGFCVMLASADLEGEVRALLTKAREEGYEKKGGALPLQIEQSVKLCRFLACTAAGSAASAAGSSGGAAAAAVPVLEALKAQLKAEVDAAVNFILKNLAALTLLEDRAVALAEAAQLLGLAGCGRKRLLLLWAALDLVRTGGAGPAAVAAGSGFTSGAGEMGPTAGAAVDVWALLKLSLAAMEPPDQPGQQDPDDVLRVHWSPKRFISWQQQHMQALAAAASRQQQQDSSSEAAAVVQQQQQPWQQQQFQQLLGPQLQLLTAMQAAALESPCLLQQLPAKQRPPGSPSKLSMVGSRTAGLQVALNAPQQLQQGSGLGVLVGVLAGMLNPSNVQQWLPGSGCLWDSLQVALMEVLVNAARLANAPVDAWEAAATLLREFYPLLPQALQSSLMETLSTCGAAMGTRLRSRPGPGPGPQVQLKRLVPGPACLQPQYLSAALSADSSSAAINLRRGEGAAGSGPFIFDPHAAKRKAAIAAAAAQAAIPEWVCGEEGRVEVVLVNACATPLKLDGLQLQVQPQQQEPHTTPPAAAAGAGVGTAGPLSDGSSGSSSNATATQQQQQQQQQRSVSVMLAAGSKPMRVLLSHVPSKAGCVAITGVQAMSKGVSWYQPFVQLLPAGRASSGGAAAAAAAVMAAAGGRDQAKPQGCFTVLVQPRLPLVKASLQGPEVQITLPSEDDLSPFTGSSSTSSSSSSSTGPSAGSSWSSAAVYGNPPAAAGGGGGGGVGPDLEKKAASVAVFEGQVLLWTLNLTNISSQPITGCKVTVLRLDAKGAVQRAPPVPRGVVGPPPSLTGAYLEVLDQGLAAGLPLQPGASLSLPVTVVVGKPPGSYDASTMQVCITYHGTASSVSSSNSPEPKVLGRSLTVPIRLAIQPTIQVRGMRFLQQGLPLRNGTRDDIILSKPQRLLLQTLREGRDHEGLGARAGVGTGSGNFAGAGVSGAGAGTIRRGASHHVRNNSEGSVPVAGISVGPMLPLPQSPSRVPPQGADGSGLSSIPSGGPYPGGNTGVDGSIAAAVGLGAALDVTPVSPTKQHGAAARQGGSTAAAAAAAGGVLALCSQPVLELAVRNASERYFRTWLGCLPDRLKADKALSAVAVLEPGDQEKLTAAVPSAAASATPPPPSKAAADAASGVAGAAAAAAAAGQAASQPLVQGGGGVQREPPRLAAAEELVGRLVVCWEMITGAAAAGVLPHGCVPLEPLDVAANLTPVALAGLCPSPLHLRLSVPPATAVPSSQAPSHMVDLSALLANSSSSASSRSSIGGSGVAAGQHCSAGGAGPAADVGLKLPGVTGPVWGLHMKVGQHLVFDLDVTYAAAAAGVPATPAADSSLQSQQLDLQVTLFALDALSMNTATNGTQPPGTPTAAAAAADRAGAGSPYAAGLLSGQSLGPRSFAALLGAAASTPKAAEISTRSSSMISAAPAGSREGLVDPGVLITGCYNKLQMAVAPGGRHTCRMHALLVQPGLYVFGVADVQQVLGAADAVGGQGTSAAAAVAAGKAGPNGQKAADGGLPGRLYYNQDRLYVLVTR